MSTLSLIPCLSTSSGCDSKLSHVFLLYFVSFGVGSRLEVDKSLHRRLFMSPEVHRSYDGTDVQ